MKCSPNSAAMKYAQRECSILKRLNHPNIVGFKHSETIKLSDYLCEIKIFKEYCEHGSLKELIEERDFENR